MFNFLKKKLFGVEKKLEEALEAKIEAELAAARSTPPPAAAVPKPSTPPPAPKAQAPSMPTPLAAPAPTAASVPAPAEVAKPAPPATAPPPGEVAPAPVAPAPPVGGYREAKRLGALEESQRKKETIDERLERELLQAVESQKAVEKVVGTEDRVTLPADQLEDLLWELEVGLLEADVALPVIEAVKASVREQLTVTGVRKARAHEMVEEVLRTAITQVLNVGRLDFDEFVTAKLKEKKPIVIMFVGVNGAGKTTSIAKMAHRLKTKGISSVMAAGDTFRAGAIEQLTQHADTLGIKIIKHGPGSDPAAVAFDAIEHAKSRAKDVVLLDTAGRMQTNTNLMAEMAKIRRVARPDLVVFVGDSLAGNDAVIQAREFNATVSVDGVILTKVDADAKGGAALSVAYTIGKPLLFIGLGQGYDDQIPFDAKWMVDRLFAKDGTESTAEA